MASDLLESGARIDAVDQFGNTPLLIAVREGHDEIARFLIARGANKEMAQWAFQGDASWQSH